MAETRTLLPTTVVGSYPQPDWLVDHAVLAKNVVPRVRIAGVRVDIVALYPGADSVAIDAYLAAGAQGIVLETTGSGNTNAHVVAAVRECSVPVVVTTRVPMGPIAPTYGGGGGGADLVKAGAVFSPLLRAGQARIALAVQIALPTAPTRPRSPH